MYRCPIEYFIDNLIFNTDKSCWAAFRFIGYDFDFLSNEAKIQILYKTTRFLAGIMSDAQLLIIPVEQNLEEHFNELKNGIQEDDVLRYSAINQAEQTEAYLKQQVADNGAANDYNFYIIVKLEEYADSELVKTIKDGYEYFIKNPVNALNVWMNLDTRDILMSKIHKCMRLSDKWFFEQNKRMEMVKLSTSEVQWLLRRMAFRGLSQNVHLFYKNRKKEEWIPKADVIEMNSYEKIVRPVYHDMINLFSGSIKSENRILKVENDGLTSYQSFLVLTNIVDLEYPGCEWLYMLQQNGIQAEVCIQIQAIEYRESLRKLDLKKREIESQVEHIEEAKADVPDDIIESKEYADNMEKELKSARYPIMNTCISICLAADSKEKLEQKVMIVKGQYEDLNFIIERPLTDQLKLYMQHIPSVGCITRDFLMRLTPMNLASGTIGASHELGDKEGAYIGKTGVEQKNVFLNLAQACLLNRSASATFFGNLGVGKSFNANLLLLLNILYGGYGLIFDPKGERSHWEEKLKVLKGLITIVTLSPEPEFQGMLDPYVVYGDNIAMANELALNVISELFKINPTSYEYTALLEAARIMTELTSKGEARPSMMKLAQILDEFEKEDELFETAKMLSRRIRLQKQAGMSQLLIGDGTQERVISLDNRLNILQIQNLQLPSPEAKKEDYTSEETLSTVLMMVLSHFAKKFAMKKMPYFKIILFDESWALGKTTEGVKLYDFLSRMGRSLFTGCIFNGHSVLDIPTEGIKNTITYKFCFQTTNDAEADRMCKYLGLESTKENKNIIKELGNGECLFQDLNKRVGILKFDAVFQEIIDVFSTTPTTHNKENEEEKETEDAISSQDILTTEDNILISEEENDIDIYQLEEEKPEILIDAEEIYKHKNDHKVIYNASLPLYENPDAMIKERKIANKVLVGFTGTEEHIGVTHNLLLCAGYLRKNGYRIACVENKENVNKSFEQVKELAFGRVEEDNEKFTVDGIDYYASFDLDNIHMILAENYHFVLIDFGTFCPELLKEFGRCVIQIIVSGSKPWQLPYMNKVFESFHEDVLKQFFYLFSLTDKDMYPVLKKNMGTLDHVIIADTIPDPLSIDGLTFPEKIFGGYFGNLEEQEKEPVKKKGLLGDFIGKFI